MAVPVAARLATVGLAAEQKDWAAVPVGAAGVAVTVAVTSKRAVLSQPETVWEVGRAAWRARAEEVASAEPPLEEAYQRMAVPVAARLATVGLAAEQKDWAA